MSKITPDERVAMLEEEIRQLREEKSRKAANGRATRLNSDWRPREQDINWAATDFPGVDLTQETAKFRDYWIGNGKTKVNWDATFRNWIRKAAAPSPYAPRSQAGSLGRAAQIRAANRERARSALDKLDQIRGGSTGRLALASSKTSLQ